MAKSILYSTFFLAAFLVTLASSFRVLRGSLPDESVPWQQWLPGNNHGIGGNNASHESGGNGSQGSGPNDVGGNNGSHEVSHGESVAVNMTEGERWLIYYTNELRQSYEKPALCVNNKLILAARDSVEKQTACNEMAHVTCDGSTPDSRVTDVGYRYTSLGENVAMMGGACSSDKDCAHQAVYNLWKNSPPHLKNMLGDFKHAGMSANVFKDDAAQENLYFTQDFGTSSEEKCDEVLSEDENNGSK